MTEETAEDADAPSVPNEEQIAETVEILRRTPYFALCALTAEGELTVIRKGIPEHALPTALRGFADSVAETIAESMVRQAVNDAPASMKGKCPSCQNDVLMLPMRDGSNILQKDGSRARAVCTCGAFLIPVALNDGALGLRLMTMEEIAELPDHKRNEMLAVRRRYAGYAARDKARREKGN